jgi:putative ABC transport system permease protein
MKIKDIVLTANKNLMESKLRTALTVGAIFVGAFFLTLSLGIGKGTRGFVNQQLEGLSMDNTFIVSSIPDFGIEDFIPSEPRQYDPEDNTAVSFLDSEPISSEALDNIRDIQGVQEVQPSYFLNIEYVQINGQKYVPNVDTYYSRTELPIATDSAISNLESNEVILGYGFVTALDTTPEELIGNDIKININDKNINAKVGGVIEDSILLNAAMAVPPEIAEEISANSSSRVLIGDGALQAFVILEEDLSSERITEIRSELSEKDLTISTYEEQTGTFDNFILGIQAVLIVFSVIVLLVSVFAIANTLFMSVYERTREVGLMKAIGMRDRAVFMLFAVEAAIIGFWGSIIGIIGANIFGLILNFLASRFLSGTFETFRPFSVPLTETFIIILVIMAIAFLAGTIPALKASRLDPIDALKYE